MNNQIYYNGEIITMEENLYVDAMLVENGLIKKLGTESEILSLKNSSTKVINLNGSTLIPAFIDAHSHISSFATSLGLIPLSNAKTFDEIVQILKNFKESHKLTKNDWIIGFGYDNNSLKENAHPTKEILDKVSLENPILISNISGHMGVANSAALKAIEITKETTDPEGGKIGRENNSLEPNGYLEENAFIHNTAKIPSPSLNSILSLLDEAQNIYLSYGITTVQDGLVNTDSFSQLEEMANQQKLKIDIIGYVDLKTSKKLLDNTKFKNKYFNRYKLGGYKIFLDGSPQGKTAWMSKPYENEDRDYCGYPIYLDSEVKDFIKTSLNEHLQLLTHCNGDAAADQLITCFSEVYNNGNYSSTNRPVMIHAQTVRDDELARMKEIQMIPSFFTAHTYYWGDAHIKNLGKERAFKISPAKTAIKNHLIYTFHQDTPVIKPNMLETIWCAVNRISKNGVVLGEEEKISPLEALKGVTINAAYQYFEEDLKGSLKEGKLADFVILDKNPLTINPMDIRNIKVLKTIKEGKVLYSIESIKK